MYICETIRNKQKLNIMQLVVNNIKKESPYARIEKIGKHTYMVIDSADQGRFATDTLKKAENFLAKLLKQAGY